MIAFVGKIVKGASLIVPPYVAFSDIFFSVRMVDGSSMQPTLNPDGKDEDFVLVNKWKASQLKFERGDVVTLISPKDPTQHIIKRIVALEGDQVKSLSCFSEKVDIPRGHCWIEGDNNTSSMDSNNYGPVSLGLISARATHVLWPPNRWGRIAFNNPAQDRVTVADQVERGQMFFGWDL